MILKKNSARQFWYNLRGYYPKGVCYSSRCDFVIIPILAILKTLGLMIPHYRPGTKTRGGGIIHEVGMGSNFNGVCMGSASLSSFHRNQWMLMVTMDAIFRADTKLNRKAYITLYYTW